MDCESEKNKTEQNWEYWVKDKNPNLQKTFPQGSFQSSSISHKIGTSSSPCKKIAVIIWMIIFLLLNDLYYNVDRRDNLWMEWKKLYK